MSESSLTRLHEKRLGYVLHRRSVADVLTKGLCEAPTYKHENCSMEMGVRNACRGWGAVASGWWRDTPLLAPNLVALVLVLCYLWPHHTLEVTGPFYPAGKPGQHLASWYSGVWRSRAKLTLTDLQGIVFYLPSVTMKTRTFPKVTSLSVLVRYYLAWPGKRINGNFKSSTIFPGHRLESALYNPHQLYL
jgi:hypothetical protein